MVIVSHFDIERMASKRGELSGDWKRPKLYEPDFIEEMNDFGFSLNNKVTGELVSNLIFYTLRQRLYAEI
jgi:hypothetical protein